MPPLPMPDIPPGNLRKLVQELHLLHRRAGWPSLREMAKGQTFSYASVHDLFTKTISRPPRLEVLRAVAQYLASKTRNADEEQALDQFEALWSAAAEAPFDREDRSTPEETHTKLSLTAKSDVGRPSGIPPLTPQLRPNAAGHGQVATGPTNNVADFSVQMADLLPRELRGDPFRPSGEEQRQLAHVADQIRRRWHDWNRRTNTLDSVAFLKMTFVVNQETNGNALYDAARKLRDVVRIESSPIDDGRPLNPGREAFDLYIPLTAEAAHVTELRVPGAWFKNATFYELDWGGLDRTIASLLAAGMTDQQLRGHLDIREMFKTVAIERVRTVLPQIFETNDLKDALAFAKDLGMVGP